MKKLLSFLFLGLLLASCSSSIEIAKRKHRGGYYVSLSQQNKHQQNNEVLKDSEKAKKQEKISFSEKNKSLSITADELKAEKLTTKLKAVDNDQVNTAELKIDASKIKKHKKQLKNKLKELKKAQKSGANDDDIYLLLLVILAIFLPPIAVGLASNWDLVKLIISILLTFLFWLPGIIYALLVVFGHA